MLNYFRQKIRNHYIQNFSIPDLEKSFQRLKDQQFSPNCIFDVGAFKGDFAKLAQKNWPQAEIICFEPLSEQVKILKQLELQNSKIKVIEGLIGDEVKEEVVFHENETASSILEEFVSKDFIKSTKKMRTIDSCIAEFSLKMPDILKIDTQGYEYEVLKGASTALQNCQLVLAELNFMDIHKNVKIADEVISYLKQFDFVMYDITEIHRRPSDNALWQVDFMFVKENSFLRQNKKW